VLDGHGLADRPGLGRLRLRHMELLCARQVVVARRVCVLRGNQEDMIVRVNNNIHGGCWWQFILCNIPKQNVS
jgi:hypothetical protein